MHRFILYNEEIRDGSEKLLSPGQVGLLSGWGVFSTVRIVEGVLFAFERHWARMSRDAALLRVPLTQDPERVQRNLLELVEANNAVESTLRLVVVRNGGSVWEGEADRPSDLIALTADLKNWGRSVKLRYVLHGRHSASAFAGAKILAWAMNLAWLEEAQCAGFDEVVLLNERGEVAECTSANIFAVQGDVVWTPPHSSGCLPGITRELLLNEIHVPGITVREKTLLPSDLESADEVFITSTTRELLPVSEIEGRKLRGAGHARPALQSAFSDLVGRYVESGRVYVGQELA